MLLRATSCAFGVLRWSITSMVASMVVSMPRRFCILKPRKGQFSMLVSYGRSLQPIGYSLRSHLLALTSKNIWNLQFWLDVKNSDESYLRELADSVYSWIPLGNYITVSDPEASGNEVLGFRLFSFDTTHWRDTGMVRKAGTEYFEILQKI